MHLSLPCWYIFDMVREDISINNPEKMLQEQNLFDSKKNFEPDLVEAVPNA